MNCHAYIPLRKLVKIYFIDNVCNLLYHEKGTNGKESTKSHL